jgi:predicted nucleic acid-binding protein
LSAFVLDASVALTFFLQTEASAASDALLQRFWSEGAAVPDFWAVEVANGILKAARRERIDAARTRADLALLESMAEACDVASAHRTRRERAYGLALRHALSSYDATYLALALDRGLPLATLDRAFVRSAAAEGVAVLPDPAA